MSVETKKKGICSNEDIEPFMKIAYNTAREYMRKINNFNLDVDDLAMTGLDSIYRYWEENKVLPDYKLAKTIVHRAVIRITGKAYAKKRKMDLNPLSLDYAFEQCNENDNAGIDNDREINRIENAVQVGNCENGDVEQNIIDKLMFDELLQQYRSDSPERRFIEFYLESTKIRDFGIYDRYPELMEKHDNQKHHYIYTKSDCAVYMGYNGVDDPRYINIANKVKKEIKEYFKV